MERNKMTAETQAGKRTFLVPLTIIMGINLLFSAGVFEGQNLPPAFAQTPSEATVTLNPSVLSIIYTPSDFVMDPVNISSPIETYYSYYNNPHTVDADGNLTTRDGTALRVQDGRFKGGFELQAQVDSDYVSGSNSIQKENLGMRTDIGGLSEVNETVTAGTTATTAPLDTVGDYTPFKTPLVLLDATTPSCDEGRVGIYTIYPSFRLQIPNSTPAGTYTTSVTYTLLEQPTC
jgi:hypothetical protein